MGVVHLFGHCKMLPQPGPVCMFISSLCWPLVATGERWRWSGAGHGAPGNTCPHWREHGQPRQRPCVATRVNAFSNSLATRSTCATLSKGQFHQTASPPSLVPFVPLVPRLPFVPLLPFVSIVPLLPLAPFVHLVPPVRCTVHS